jgi:hypothetical protein
MRQGLQCVLSAVGGGATVFFLVAFAWGTPAGNGIAVASPAARLAAGTTSNAPQQPASANVKVDDSNAPTGYANFARVTATPEEVIVDFALNPQPFAMEQNIVVSERIVLNFYTAKRLLGALESTIQKHEGVFGPIELDVRKRAKSGAKDK